MNRLAIYRITEGVRVRDESFGLLVVSKLAPALALNPDMKNVWYMIDGKSSYGDILSAVENLYPGVSVEPKVSEIFEKLLQLGLINRVNEV